MQNKQIKYCFGSLKQAKKRGLDNDYIFYMQLKGIFQYGYMPNKHVSRIIREHLPYSHRQIHRKLKRCIENGFISYKKDIGYQLRSYTKVWNKLSQKIDKRNRCRKRHRYCNLDFKDMTYKGCSLKARMYALETDREVCKQNYKKTILEIRRQKNALMSGRDKIVYRLRESYENEFIPKCDEIIRSMASTNQWYMISTRTSGKKLGYGHKAIRKYQLISKEKGYLKVYNHPELFMLRDGTIKYHCGLINIPKTVMSIKKQQNNVRKRAKIKYLELGKEKYTFV